ncbi:MAG: hypothetical protein QOE89_190 [Pseudonocardiales bacterium]|jgi:hypothetical protein|nr:hypothetical protein [Pseudonocardiales bacterium]
MNPSTARRKLLSLMNVAESSLVVVDDADDDLGVAVR